MKKKLTFLLTALFLLTGGEQILAQVTKLSDASPTKCYTITTNGRGGWAVTEKGDQFASTMDCGLSIDPTDKRQQFAILSINATDYYLYSVSAKKFIKADRTLVSGIADAIQFTDASSQGAGRVRVNFRDIPDKYINLGGSSQMVINNWGTIDNGNAVLISEAGDFDAKEALAMLSNTVTINYEFVYNNKVIYTQETVSSKGEAYPRISINLPFGVTAEIPEGVTTGDETKRINLSVSLPFTYADNYEAITDWYFLKLHAQSKNYLYYDPSIDYLDASKTRVDQTNKDAYTWGFVGDPFNGFRLVNKAAGASMVLSSASEPKTDKEFPIMTNLSEITGNTAWDFYDAGAHAENGFFIAYDGTNKRLNKQQNKLCYWLNGADAGSTFMVEWRPSLQYELSTLLEEAEALLANAQYAAVPEIGEYASDNYSKFESFIENAKNEGQITEESIEALKGAMAEFIAAKNLPVFTIDGVINYASGKSIYDNNSGDLYFKPTDLSDASMLWSFDMAEKNISVTEQVVVRNLETGNLFWGAPTIRITETAEADIEDGIFLFYTQGNNTPVHAQDENQIIVRWSRNTADSGSAWRFTYVGSTYELEALLAGEGWKVVPGAYEAGVYNAEQETHRINETLTIYTSYCHWGDELTILNKPYKGTFYSNELPNAIKSIKFEARSNAAETLLVYGSNDGETWTLVDEVATPDEEGIADFSGTTFNYFKVETKGLNNVQIASMTILLDLEAELPLIVDEPAFNIAGGNLYEPAKLELSSEQGADIYWSTDGENYEAYDEEIEIDATCTIYAYAEIDGVESKVVSETYVVAAEYENIAAMQAAVEATEEGMPVVIDLQAIITEVGEKQISINDDTAELLVSDYYLPDYYAVKDTLCGKLRGVYKLVKGQPTVCELDYSYLAHKIFVLTEAPELEGQFFTVGNATSVLKEYTWYLLRNVGRNAYVNETDVDLRMLPTTSITSMSAADDNLGVLFHLEKSENGEDLYTICSGKGNYFTIAQSSSTISAAAVDYLIKNISGNTFYIQDPTTGVVVDGNAAGGTFVGWGTTVPAGTNGNNAYQFMEVEFVDAEKAASIVKASGILNELQQEYGLVTDASQYSSNAVETTEGSLAALLDNDYTTFFHSSWSQTVEGTHYLQAEVSKPTKSLFFYFKKRSQNNNNRPTDITILGSNDGVNFTEVTRINSGLPTDAGTLDYTSSVIKATQAYKHFRFMVNATGGDTGNTQFFTFSEFYILPGESVYRNVITAANALVSADITDKNFDKLVAAFEAAYAKLKGEDEKPPVTPTGKKVVYDLNVERITGMGYAADDHYITTDKLTALLGGKKLEGAAIWGVNPDGTYVADAMATYDGWRDADGAFAYWGESAVVCAKLFQEEGSYLVELCTFPANDPEAGTKHTASWALIAGQDTVVINTNITFVAPNVINIANYEVVATMKVEHNEAANTAYSGNTAAFDAAAAAKALGVASLDDAGQYILNVTTGDLVLNTTDGWRDNKGDAAGWGNAGGVCVKIQSPSTGSIDYIGCYDDTHAAGETYTAKWAFVSGNKAAIVEVVITFIDASSISDINVDQPVTAYTISGKAIQTTASGVKNLQRGIYIINGKKVYVK